MNLHCAAVTDVGRVRPHNEDSFVAQPGAGIFAVADGMGGHAAGEVASALAAGILRELNLPEDRPGRGDQLVAAVSQANQRILAHAAAHPECHGMGTTLTALAVSITDGWAVAAHVGDSRLYLLRDARLRQLTRDHTVVQEQVERGALSAAQARDHPLGNILTRALGTEAALDIDRLELELRPDDTLLLCSDGLTGMVADDAIADLLRRETDLEAASRALVEAANQAGGRDNITVVAIRLLR